MKWNKKKFFIYYFVNLMEVNSDLYDMHKEERLREILCLILNCAGLPFFNNSL